MKVLLIAEISQFTLISKLFERLDWQVELCLAGSALARSRGADIDLILIGHCANLDSNTVLKSIRALGVMIPILVIGEQLIDKKVEALESGADEYVSNPAASDELIARIKNLMQKPKTMTDSKITLDATTVDHRIRLLRKGDRQKRLSEIECLIISFLFANSRKTFTASQIFSKLWLDQDSSSEATVRVHINSLRKKLFEIGAGNLIRVRGRGYMAFG